MNFLKDGESFRKQSDGSFVKLDRNGEVVGDGQRMTVPMVMMDGGKGMLPNMQQPIVNADHARPRFGVMTDAQVAASNAAHRKMVERTRDAWDRPDTVEEKVNRMMGGPSQTAKLMAEALAVPEPDAPAAYDRMRKRQENAWKTAKPIKL